MAISAKKRKSLKKSQFAYPRTRSYPIDTKARARNALSRAAQKGPRAVRPRRQGGTAAVGQRHQERRQEAEALEPPQAEHLRGVAQPVAVVVLVAVVDERAGRAAG